MSKAFKPLDTAYVVSHSVIPVGTKITVPEGYKNEKNIPYNEGNITYFIPVQNLSLEAPVAKNFMPHQILYTIGYSGLSDGTQVIVTDSYKGGELVSVVTGTKLNHFISTHQLTATKPVAKTTIPNYLKPIGATIITINKALFVFGHPEVKDHSVVYPAEGYVHNSLLPDIRCVKRSVSPWEYTVIEKKYLYHQPYQQHTTTRVAKPLAKEAELSEDHKYMVELLKEPKRDEVINLVMRGVDVTAYEIIKAPKYFVLVPKEPETLYMPMIMAHTDIQRNVSHPTDDNLEYDKDLDKFTSPKGLGADDRAGCYAINKILLNHPGKFIVALFDEEEIGCIGSGAFADSTDFPRVNRLASCYISIDRKRGHGGIAQIATYGHDNKQLFSLIETATGRKTVSGSSTDCATLSRKSYSLPISPGQTKLACFNMSCGYENEHTVSEALYFTELQQVVEDFNGIVDLAYDLWEAPFASEHVVVKTKTKTTSDWGNAEELIVDGEIYDEADVRALLYYYRQTTGKAFKFTDLNKVTKEFEKNNYVRLDQKCSPNGVFGGMRLTQDMYNSLVGRTWVVTKVNELKMLCDIVSEDGGKQGTNIPYALLELVLIGDPLVETIGA